LDKVNIFENKFFFSNFFRSIIDIGKKKYYSNYFLDAIDMTNKPSNAKATSSNLSSQDMKRIEQS
jgi:hypothetical protein